jgi:hypothetical protein
MQNFSDTVNNSTVSLVQTQDPNYTAFNLIDNSGNKQLHEIQFWLRMSKNTPMK